MQKLQKHNYTLDGAPIVSKSLARFVRCSPRKVRYVAEAIRNKSAAEALEILDFTHRPSAVPHLRKVLVAAMAAAVNEGKASDASVGGLRVAEVIVNDAPMIKRMRPASMGRAVRVRKRNSHIFLALSTV